jgi:putative ABC transport system permease protein
LNYARNIIDLRNERVGPFIKAKVKDGIAMKYASDDLKSAMRSIRKLRPSQEDNFALNESTLFTQSIAGLFSTVNFAGGFIAVFSIIVGGFGIANIMFVSVKERTNQIGIQKSLGAKRYFILLQFLVEAVTLCLIGGAAGLLIIYFLTFFAEGILGFSLVLTFENLMWGLGISAFIGILSGFIPAWSASRLDPVEAIRSNG